MFTLTSPLRKQYRRAMKKPWNDMKKCAVYDHMPNSRGPGGGSTIDRKFVMPSNGSNTMAAFTAFLETIINNNYILLSYEVAR